jgi:SAM-dependent methyltransferase
MPPTTDPSSLYALREGSYAGDLLITAIAELDFFTFLADRPSAPLDICEALGLTPGPVDVMCTFFVALGLIDCRGEKLEPTQLALEHLVAGSEWDLRPYFTSLADRPAVAELLGVLQSGKPAGWASAAAGKTWEERLAEPDFAAEISVAMDARGRYLAPLLADALSELNPGRVLDVAGGSGIYASAVVDKGPNIEADVLERAPVDVAARAILDRRGYGERVGVVTGDMFEDPLPGGYDLHLYSHVFHDWNDESVRRLVRSSFDSLSPGGWIVDHDAHLAADKAGPLSVAAYSILLMHSTEGRCRSTVEISELFEDAGFKDALVSATGIDRSAVIAQKPHD